MRLSIVLVSLFLVSISRAEPINYESLVQRSNSLLEKLVNAKPITGCEHEAAQIIASRLKELDLPFEIIQSGDAPAAPLPAVSDEGGKCLDGRQPSQDKRPNIVVKLPANTGSKTLKSLMIVAHMDVVPAIKQVWSQGIEAHKYLEKDGFIYGRGTLDMLSYLTLAVEMFGEIKKNNLPLERDLVLMLNSDEEKGGFHGLGWLTNHRPDLFQNVEFALSEGGSTIADDDQKPLFIGYEAAQKRYQDFKITATGTTGHSSTPSKIQAIHLLMNAIDQIKNSPAIPRLIPIIRSYFRERAKVETDQELRGLLTKIGNSSEVDGQNLYNKYSKEVGTLEQKYPVIHALLRRTCTPTVVEAGNANAKNAQPQTAIAYVNCRLMPDETVDNLLAVFQSRINKSFGKLPTDPSIKIDLDIDYRGTHAGASDIEGEIPNLFQKYAKSYFSGIPVIPSMLTAATDLKYLRKMGIQSYGFGPVIMADNDKKRAHGVDERIYEGNLKFGIEMFSNMVQDIAAPTKRSPANVKEISYPGKPSKNFKNSFGNNHEHSGACAH